MAFRLCEAVAGALFTQRLCAGVASKPQQNRDLSLILPRMKIEKPATGQI